MKLLAAIEELFPISRSLSGVGNRRTLQILSRYANIKMRKVASGTKIFDWIVPDEWRIDECYVENIITQQRIIDFNFNNLHVLGYSEPLDTVYTGSQLKNFLITDKSRPEVIPYVTSYYTKLAGVCCAHNQLSEISDDDNFHVKVQSEKFNGYLDYGVGFVERNSNKTFLISCYICHPSMANDSLSGVVIATKVLQYFQRNPNNLKGYNLLVAFVPETIGALAFLKQDLALYPKVFGGLVLTCLGDAGDLTYKKSFDAFDDINQIVGGISSKKIKIKNFSATGSDERQYCSPGMRLPVGVFTRSPYGEFNEYHSSADNIDFVKEKYLNDSYESVLSIIERFCGLRFFKRVETIGEPMLSKYELYPSFGGLRMKHDQHISLMMEILCMTDGSTSTEAISSKLNVDINKVQDIMNILVESGLAIEI